MQTQIEAALRAAVVRVLGEEYADADPLVTPATNPKFGDYQANLAMGLAKRVGAVPRELAGRIVAQLQTASPDVPGGNDWLAAASVAGPGFINLTVSQDALNRVASELLADGRLGVPEAAEPQRIVVDYSAPNVAKEMHVGHLRSTIIGDAIARVLGFLGHDVIRQNHVGDWGTQFGMLIENLLDRGFDLQAETSPAELTAIYQASKKRFDEDADFAERARRRVVALQGGDAQTLEIWRALVEVSKRYFQGVYDRLGVQLTEGDIRGESFYNDRLADLVARMEREGTLSISDGAAVVYPDGFVGKDAEPLPLIVRKSDGGYLYATTDLAAALFRVEELGAQRIVYVIGLPQRQHVGMFTTALRQLGWISSDVRIDYVGFGSVLGADRRMFKTRSGDTVRLTDLLDEAEQRAAEAIAKKNPQLSDEERAHVARVVGIGALKYADLSSDRVKDYVFDWERMLALDGNTAPYMIYSYVRVQSIFRKAQAEGLLPEEWQGSVAARSPILANEEAERALVLQLVQFPRVVQSVAESLEPHRLCNYLYELATRYHRFFEQCSVLRAEDAALRASRLSLCFLVAQTLKSGLDLLGIDVVERM